MLLMHSKWDMISNSWLTYTYHIIFNLNTIWSSLLFRDLKVLICLQMNYVVSVLPHKMSSESNLDEWHSDNIKCQNEMTIKYLHVFYKPNFHAQVLFFCKMSGEVFFDFPLNLVRCLCPLICLNIVLLTESDPALSLLIFYILLDIFVIMIYWNRRKNSNFRRLQTRKS